MTSGERAFLERHIALWSARGAALRAEGGRLAHNLALGLDGAVGQLRARLAAAPIVDARAAEIAALEAQLAECQPYRGQGGVMFNNGPIMGGLRHDIACRLAALRGEPVPARPVPPARPVFAPPPEPEPFEMGPQMEMFG